MVLPKGIAPDSGHLTTVGSKVLSTVYNPFSIRNNQPKWPDGLASYSIGKKRQYCSEVYGRDLVIALFPGYYNWCQAYEWNEALNHFFLATNHHQWNIDDLTFFATANVAKWYQTDYKTAKYASWRPVSVGLRIECANNDEDNDGWFEAIRTSRDTYRHRFGILAAQGATATEPNTPFPGPIVKERPFCRTTLYHGMVLPSDLTVQEWHSARNWALQPSYATGKLKDIGDYIFALNQSNNDNEFIKLRPVSTDGDGVQEQTVYRRNYDLITQYSPIPVILDTNPIPAGNAMNFIPITEVAQENGLPTTATKIPDFQKSFVSDAFDMILIRVHGLDVTRLMIHTVSNLELTCNEHSPYAQFLTISYPNKDALDAFKAVQAKQRERPFFLPDTGRYFA